MKNLVEILLPIAASHSFVYQLPLNFEQNIEQYKVGAFVKVHFRNKLMYGIIWNTNPKDYKECVNYKKIDSLVLVLKPLEKSVIEFMKYFADYNITPIGMVLKMIVPMTSAQIDKIIDKLNSVNQNQYHSPQADIIDKLLCNDKSDCNQNTTYCLPKLTEKQAHIAQKINTNTKKYSVSVLHGITGSGKTEVYLWLAMSILKSGGQVLIIVPEIVLTTQLIDRFKKYISTDEITQWHSSLSPAKRREIWSNINRGEHNFIVGARSALFLPFKNLKMIIIDEEHDISLKQEDRVNYHARDMAIVRAKMQNIPLLLISATPSIETLFNVDRGKFNYYCLHERYGGILTPQVQLIDIRTLNKENRQSTQQIHELSRKAIIKTIAKNKQSLIFINRRGYAPTIFCTKCLNKFKCPNCSAHLVYHKIENKVQCHYCGYRIMYTNRCHMCKEENCLVLLGHGVERIAEEVQIFAPSARIFVITSDTINTHSKAQDAIRKISNRDIDVIIGTQMITKGLHFPYLELVVVVDADPNVLGGDIRSLEHTHQILHQVMGRAGRDKERGTVLIQTTHPNSQLLLSVINNDVMSFTKAELKRRQEAFVPPFARLVSINLISYNEQMLIKFSYHLVSIAPMQNEKFTILGPAPAPMYFLNKRYRYRIIVRANKDINIQKLVKAWINKCDVPNAIKIRLYVDPYNFM